MPKKPAASLKEDQFKVFRTKVHALLERPKVRRSVIKALADAHALKLKPRSRARSLSANGKRRPDGRSDRWLDNQLSPSYAARARGPKAAASTITIAAAREIIAALCLAIPNLTMGDAEDLFDCLPAKDEVSTPALIVFPNQSKRFAACQVDRLFKREPGLHRWRARIEASLTLSLMEYELFVPGKFPIAQILLGNAVREIIGTDKKTEPNETNRRALREIVRMAKEFRRNGKC